MSNEKSGDNFKRVYVEFKRFNINRTGIKISEEEAANLSAAKLLLWNLHTDIKPKNLIVAEGNHDVDMVIEIAQSYPQTAPSVRQAPPGNRRKVNVEVAPGFKLHGWLSSLCPRRFKENVLDECLATGTLMYQEKLAEGDEKGARRVRWAMRFWMLRAAFGGFVTGAFMLLGRFGKTSD